HDWAVRRSAPPSYPPARRELRRTVAAVRPDVVHLHSFFGGLLGRLPFAGLAGVPVVYQPHAWSFDVVGNRQLASLMRGWERLASRRTDVLVANCSDEIDEGRRVGITNSAVPLGVAVDTEHFAPVDAAGQAQHRAELGVSRPRLLLSVGRLARQKGQDLLVAAWEQAPLAETELVFVGIDDDTPLRALAPSQWGRTVRAVPTVTDVRPWLWACDTLVLPSRYETVSLAVAEAMACGRPAVATSVNGVAETVVGKPWPPGGSVVPVGDMVGLLRESATLLADADLRAERGAAARVRALEQFTPGVVVDRLDCAYREAIEHFAARQRKGRPRRT
ncbi:MAG: glycosyltransferase, partial [Actinomycetota bacterium]|nr:glycosyltransferase [Actinomycetota bacterium]